MGRLLQRPAVQLACRKVAVKMQATAEAMSPVGNPTNDHHSGEYRSSFVVVPIEKNVPFRGRPHLRAGARLMNTAPHSRHVEYGNGETPRYAVLSKTVDAFKAAHHG
ncbi:hypothetical protein ADL27_38360 [Streptomyces sp. NRRL F-6602]|nr:hypothetical protein ADL27_38360 [Streptomyces sp. NRRL F-6602]